jgi:hypothetical protein
VVLNIILPGWLADTEDENLAPDAPRFDGKLPLHREWLLWAVMPLVCE